MSPHPDDLTGMKDDMTAFIEGLGMRRFFGYVECEEVPSVLWDSGQNPPLIASSIMSKKIAEGTAALVLDVKVGSGAFMREIGAARQLARTMVTLGAEHGVRTAALLTQMDTPLGRAVGNAVEVQESVAALRGAGPADLVEVTLALAAEMLRLAGIGADPAAALADGRV